jgi:hypothetical protein
MFYVLGRFTFVAIHIGLFVVAHSEDFSLVLTVVDICKKKLEMFSLYKIFLHVYHVI